MVAVKYDDLATAFDFVSGGDPMENEAYVSLDTGNVYWVSNLIDDDEEELPDDLETSDRYLLIPDKSELGLGKRLALRFAAEYLPQHYEQAEGFFSRKGAYARFKDLLERKGMLERWYAFEAEAIKRELKQWCADNGMEILET